jgi:hypothetical protein
LNSQEEGRIAMRRAPAASLAGSKITDIVKSLMTVSERFGNTTVFILAGRRTAEYVII